MTPLRVLLAVPVVLLATALVALCWPDARPAATAVSPATADPAVEVLRDWDDRRAAAWAEADPTALAGLYAAGSRTGRRDAALLAAYVDRGVRVDRLETQLLAVRVRVREADRLVLVVTDRLARVALRHGDRALVVPEDRPTTYRVALVRPGDTWVVEEARPAPQPAR